MSDRSFRTPESLTAEVATRDMIPSFLTSVGFGNVSDERTHHGSALSQTIRATSRNGESLAIRVRLCWRFGRGKGDNYSAAQLMARIKNGHWEGTIRDKLDRERSRGITHLLLVQPEGSRIQSAALIPLDAVLPIWCAQRDISARLGKTAKPGRKTKNHAMNGLSPTLYLRDDRDERAVELAEALWNYPGVQDLAKLPPQALNESTSLVSGFSDPEINRVVEKAAVDLVRRQYEDQGWTVRSVEQEGCGFDLDCRRGTKALHIEVKGISGLVEHCIVTAGEFRRAESDPLFRIALVTSALTANAKVFEYDGPGFLRNFETSPVQYRATLRAQAG